MTEPGERFSVPDEVCCYFDTADEPANIHLEIRVPGRLDRVQFRAAALAALSANPRTSRRRAAGHRLRIGYHWERPPALDHDAISFTTWRDAEELARQRNAFVAQSPSIDHAPGAALLVATGPGCEYIILNAHHAVMDGLSWLNLLADLARRYRAATGRPASVPPANLAAPAIAVASPNPGTPNSSPDRPGAGSAGLANGARRPEFAAAVPASEQSRRGRAALLARLHSGPRPPARVAADLGGGHGCGVLLYLLSGVPAVPPSMQPGERITLNDALIAALIATISDWNADHGSSRREVRVTMPINARSATEQTAAGNHSRIVPIAVTAADGGGIQELLAEVARQTRQARRQSGPQVPAGTRGLAAVPLPALAKRWLVRCALRLAGPRICDTVLLTNLGNVADPPDFGLGGTITMGLTGPAQMPRGLSLAAITAGRQLQLGFRYNRALLDESAAESFAARYLRVLATLTTEPTDSSDGEHLPAHRQQDAAVAACRWTYQRS